MLKVWEASALARVGTAAIRKGVASGEIPHLKFGRNVLIPRAAFLRWLDSCGRAMRSSQHAEEASL
jgi:excisionase family DNA binding protein